MATEIGQKDSGLSGSPATERFQEITRRLRLEPFAFRFFQAVWLLERYQPDRAPVGQFGDPGREAVRFTTRPSLAFPASDIHGIDWNSDPPEMCVNFMGLTGPSGVLPHVYTQLIEERARAQDRSLQDFLDIFNHRLISLFYTAWKRYRFPVDISRFRYCLLSLTGLGTRGLEQRQTVDDDSFLFCTGLLALQPRSATALEQILAEYFQVPVEVDQFVGAWYRLASDSTFRFEETDPLSATLGSGVVVGDEVWDQQSRVTVRLGPLTIQQYEEFLPGRLGNRRLRDITRFFSRDELDFQAQLILRRNEVPACRLDEMVQLGWTTWIKTGPKFPRDVADTVLALQ